MISARVLPNRWLALVLMVAVVTALDLSRHPSRQVSSRVLSAAIACHQATVAPWLATIGVRCRFEPSCSRYAEQVVSEHGAVCGSWLTLRRLTRCGPWTESGTVDPPPRGPARP